MRKYTQSRKITAMVLAFGIVLSMAGCGSSKSSSPSETASQTEAGGGQTTDTTAAPSGDVLQVQLGLSAAENSQWYTAALAMEEQLDKESSGAIQLDIYPSAQLGSQTDMFDQMVAGASVIGVGTPAYFSDLGVADMSILAGPYIVSNWEDMQTLIDSDWFGELEKQLEALGIKVLNFNIQCGKRHTLATKEMHTPEDFKGVKIRVPNSTTYIKIYEAMGAAPVPMNLGEVYTSLSQNVIEGEDNNIATMYSEKHYEVAKYLIEDGHILDLQCLCTSTSWFNSLTEDQQQMLINASDTFAQVYNENTAKDEQKLIDEMKENGVVVIDDCVPEDFQKATLSFYTDPAIAANWSEGLYEKIQEILKK